MAALRISPVTRHPSPVPSSGLSPSPVLRQRAAKFGTPGPGVAFVVVRHRAPRALLVAFRVYPPDYRRLWEKRQLCPRSIRFLPSVASFCFRSDEPTNDASRRVVSKATSKARNGKKREKTRYEKKTTFLARARFRLFFKYYFSTPRLTLRRSIFFGR